MRDYDICKDNKKFYRRTNDKFINSSKEERADELNNIICPRCGYQNHKQMIDKYGRCNLCKSTLNNNYFKKKMLSEVRKMNQKEEDVNYINNFSKITITKACKHFGFNQSNICSGKSTSEAIRKVRKYLENEIANLYRKEAKKYVENDNSL